MVEAVQTSVSAAGTWAIVIAAVILLAFWLTAILLADRSQVRASGRAPMAGGLGRGGAWADVSIADEQTAEIPGEAVHEPVRQVPQGEVPTRADLPVQRAASWQPSMPPSSMPPPSMPPPSMPRQRTGDADRAARSQAGPGAADDAEPGRPD